MALGNMCLATHVLDVWGGAADHSGWDALVQPGTATSSPGLPKSDPIPCPTINPGGLIVGEHYTGTDPCLLEVLGTWLKRETPIHHCPSLTERTHSIPTLPV